MPRAFAVLRSGMDLAHLLSLVLGGLVVGSLARLAVPGPDPMPLWLTVSFGLVGVFVGGGAGFALAAEYGAFLGAVVCATLVVIGYRRFVQRRGVTGPGAHARPTRGIGIPRLRTRSVEDATRPAASGDALEELARLVALRDAGRIDPAEFERRKAALVARL